MSRCLTEECSWSPGTRLPRGKWLPALQSWNFRLCFPSKATSATSFCANVCTKNGPERVVTPEILGTNVFTYMASNLGHNAVSRRCCAAHATGCCSGMTCGSSGHSAVGSLYTRCTALCRTSALVVLNSPFLHYAGLHRSGRPGVIVSVSTAYRTQGVICRKIRPWDTAGCGYHFTVLGNIRFSVRVRPCFRSALGGSSPANFGASITGRKIDNSYTPGFFCLRKTPIVRWSKV